MSKNIKYVLLSFVLLFTFTAFKAEANTPGSIFTQNLSNGSAGEDVKALQYFLISKGYDLTGYTPGTFDWETQTELAKYQITKGISSTGNFGPITRNAVIADVGSVGIPTPVNTTPVTNTNLNSSVYTRNLTYGANGADVTALQNFLTAKGYDVTGDISGDFGYSTQAELARYQGSKGISSTGNFGPMTRAAVIAEISTGVAPTPSTAPGNANSTATSIFAQNLSFGSNGADVTLLQNFLISKGYNLTGYASGLFDFKTQSALASYQATKGISTTGTFGPRTRAAVIADVGSGTIPSPTTQTTAATTGSSAVVNHFTRDLSYSATGDDVVALQIFLLSKGYKLTGYTSGLYDYPTQRDLGRYQVTKGIGATGNLGPRTRAAILADGGGNINVNSASTTVATSYIVTTTATSTNTDTGTSSGSSVFTRRLEWGSSGADVKALQDFLIAKGYSLAGYTSGVYEDETVNAVQQYQASKNIPTTGGLGPLTTAAVLKDMASH